MTKRILYPIDDGKIEILSPAPECPWPVEVIAARDVPTGKPYKIVNKSDLPADRAFRAAWEADFSDADACGVTINMPKAREIGHELRRAQRQAQLFPLDARINYAVADSAKVAEIEAQRQTIRDANAAMQTAIDAATTPEAITKALGVETGERTCA